MARTGRFPVMTLEVVVGDADLTDLLALVLILDH
jgi:hypothetical protein